MSFEEALEEHAKLLKPEPSEVSRTRRGVLAQRHWRVVTDSIHGTAGAEAEYSDEELKKLKDEFAKAEKQLEPNPIMFLTQWAERVRMRECYPLWHEEGDTESKVFFDSLPLNRSADDQYVRLGSQQQEAQKRVAIRCGRTWAPHSARKTGFQWRIR